jgi:hypothetical protein
MYITNNPQVALIAEKYGVERIWIDLETLDKELRQKGRDGVKSHHTVEDIRSIRPLLSTSEMLVRINHWNSTSVEEINQVTDAGADIIMLPYWKTIDEVKGFITAVDGRCKTTLLLETKEAVEILDDVLTLDGIDEIHIGLNDLHISYGLDFMFELLTNGTVDRLCEKIAAKGIPYGFGGIARLGAGAVPAERIILEHYRLGSTRAILSRSFCDSEKVGDLGEIEKIFAKGMKEFREYEAYAANASEETIGKNREELKEAVAAVAATIRAKRAGE